MIDEPVCVLIVGGRLGSFSGAIHAGRQGHKVNVTNRQDPDVAAWLGKNKGDSLSAVGRLEG
jgi:hypothetical protein